MTSYTLPFGKFRGQPPSSADVGYLLWMLKVCKLSSGLRTAIRTNLRNRGVEEDQLPPEPEAPPPTCRRCGGVELRLTWQPLGNTESRVIRADCRRCGAFVYFAPQSAENIALADADGIKGPIGPLVGAAEEYEVRLLAEPDATPGVVRVRQFLKQAERRWRLRCTGVRPIAPGLPTRAQDATSGPATTPGPSGGEDAPAGHVDA